MTAFSKLASVISDYLLAVRIDGVKAVR